MRKFSLYRFGPDKFHCNWILKQMEKRAGGGVIKMETNQATH